MDLEKMEPLLNLADGLSEDERSRSPVLSAGYDEAADSWEIIIKYNGNLEETLPQGITLEPLIAGYGILTVPLPLLEDVAPNPQIEYAELPKRLYFEQGVLSDTSGDIPPDVRNPFADSRNGETEKWDMGEYIRSGTGLDSEEGGLTGKNVLIAVLDSGLDYTLPNFRYPDGSTKVAALWDQSLTVNETNPPPQGFTQGRLFIREDINAALQLANPWDAVPSVDISGHGTAVASIAASRRIEGEYAGVAPDSELLVVKLGNPADKGFPRTTELMRALTFSVRYAFARNLPLAVNLSFGNSYGSHNGTSLLERFIDNVSEIGRTVVCIGTGNDGLSGGRFSGRLTRERNTVIEIQIASYEANLSIQFWKNFVDAYELCLLAPNGQFLNINPELYEKKEGVLGNTRVLACAGQPTPYSTNQEIYFDLLPEEYYIDEGIWRIFIRPKVIRNGFFYLYLPVASTRNQGTRFLNPSSEMTLTIPSTAARAIAVSACDPLTGAFADFSGRGAASLDRFQEKSNIGAVRPTIAAPGVDIPAPTPGGGYALFTGTSFASPFAAGAAALMMEWGIARGHDYFLYGEKLKAELIRAASPVPGIDEYPSEKVGFGRLLLK